MQYDLRPTLRRIFNDRCGMPARRPVPTNDEDLIGTREVMQMTGMSRDWVYETFQYPTKGGVRPIKMGPQKNAQLRWRRLDVKVWIANRFTGVRA